MSWVGEGAEGAEGADRRQCTPDLSVLTASTMKRVNTTSGSAQAVTAASRATRKRTLPAALRRPRRHPLHGRRVRRRFRRSGRVRRAARSRAANGASGTTPAGPPLGPQLGRLDLARVLGQGTLSSWARLPPDGRVEAGRVSSRLARACLTPSCHRPVSVFAGGPLVLVDVLDQRVPHEVGHRLAPPRRDALRRIPQLVVDSDGVLGGRSRVPPHALGHVLTVDLDQDCCFARELPRWSISRATLTSPSTTRPRVVL
jgi:hypothetical protein